MISDTGKEEETMAKKEQKSGLGLGLGQGDSEGLTPWEQHSAVISIPRFDYKAPSSLVEHSHSGFLITCTIKREKSATKEAISILSKYVGSLGNEGFENLGTLDETVAGKRRKIRSEEIDGECIIHAKSMEATNIVGDSGSKFCEISTDASLSSVKTDANEESGFVLSLVKLTRSGLLLFTFPRNNSPNTVDILSNIFHSLDSGILRPPLWCHRIFPIQATSCLNEKDLRTVVSKLVQQFLDDKRNEIEKPLKFAVGYNRRGIEEREMKVQKTDSRNSNLCTILDRNTCFSVVAGAVNDVVSDSVVDLKSPKLTIHVELLPISAVPGGSLVAAVSALPHNLVSTKPRLCVKALVSDTRSKSERS